MCVYGWSIDWSCGHITNKSDFKEYCDEKEEEEELSLRPTPGPDKWKPKPCPNLNETPWIVFESICKACCRKETPMTVVPPVYPKLNTPGEYGDTTHYTAFIVEAVQLQRTYTEDGEINILKRIAEEGQAGRVSEATKALYRGHRGPTPSFQREHFSQTKQDIEDEEQWKERYEAWRKEQDELDQQMENLALSGSKSKERRRRGEG